MRDEHFDAWVAAMLKPAIWRQGREALEVDDCYCPLGLLLRQDRWTKGLTRRVTRGVGVYSYQGAEMAHFPSTEYLNEIKLDRGLAQLIVDMNDHKEKSFIDVAEWVVKNKSKFLS